MKLTHRQKLAVLVLAIEVIPLIVMYPGRDSFGYLASAMLLMSLTLLYIRREPQANR
jgi:hypothetical protein